MKRKRSLREIKAYINKIAPAPESLKAMQEQAKHNGLDRLTRKEIDAEIEAVRNEHKRTS
jgi:hypothetical protein